MRPLSPVWVSACLAEARDPDSAIVNEYTLLPEHCPSTRPGELFRVEPGGGARLGRRRGARGQARRARPAGHRGARRRLVPVRQPGRGAPRRDGAPAAGAVRRRQQRDVGRGAPRHPRHVPARRGGAQQPAALYRPRRVAGLRAGLRRRRRLWRAGRGPGRTAGRARRARCTPSMSRSARRCST